MFKICNWNVRGLSDPLKQFEVKNLIRNNQLSLIGLIETHVRELNKSRIRNNINPSWIFLDNDSNNSVGRILVCWDSFLIQVPLLHASPQAIFLDVCTSSFSFVATFIYGDNYYLTRNELWNSIMAFVGFNFRPWILLGDFNSIIIPSDKIGGAEILPHHLKDFHNCVQSAHLLDLPFSGCFYTWTNFQQL